MFNKILKVIKSFIIKNFRTLTEYEMLIRGLTKNDARAVAQLKDISDFLKQLNNEIYYTLGFVFTHDMRHVALITKYRPSYQNGLLNGIGGLVEQTETVIAGMVREFKEETGRDTVESDWKLVELFNPDGSNCYIFAYAMVITDADSVNTTTDEEVNWYLVDGLIEDGVTKSILVPDTLRLIKASIKMLSEG